MDRGLPTSVKEAGFRRIDAHADRCAERCRPPSVCSDRDTRIADKHLHKHLVPHRFHDIDRGRYRPGPSQWRDLQVTRTRAELSCSRGGARLVAIVERDGRAGHHHRPPFRIERHIQDVHRRVTHETCHEAVRGTVEDLLGRGVLLDDPVADQADPIGHRQRLGLVVGHIEGGGPEALLQAPDLAAHADAEPGVEIGQRFVHQECGGIADDGPGQGDALSLAARELPWPSLEEVGDLQRLGHRGHRGRPFARRDAADPERVTDVVLDRHMRVQRVALEDHRHIPLARRQSRHVPAADVHMPGGRFLQAGNDAQSGRLAAAGRAKQHDELTVAHGEIERLEHANAVEALLDPCQLDLSHRPSDRQRLLQGRDRPADALLGRE